MDDAGLVYASAADIIRSSQKDQFYCEVLRSDIEAVSRRLFGSRLLANRANEFRTGANFLYLALTTLIGQRTLGEEYCDIVLVTLRKDRVAFPSSRRRALLVGSTALIPYVLSKLGPQFKKALILCGLWSDRLAKYATVMSPYLSIRNLETAHLALFYFTGTYYTFAARFSAIRYMFVRKINASSERIGYEVLGFLMLTRLMVPLLQNLAFVSGGEQVQTQVSTNISIDLEDESQMPFMDEQARKCTLCLSSMQDPTATSCGHLFCWTCITEWTRTKPECPLCRQSAAPSHLLPLRF